MLTYITFLIIFIRIIFKNYLKLISCIGNQGLGKKKIILDFRSNVEINFTNINADCSVLWIQNPIFGYSIIATCLNYLLINSLN
jgi:hypothetical protein